MDEYCQEELQVHYEATIRFQAEVTRRDAVSLRVAFNAKAKSFSKYLKDLEATGKRIDRTMGRTKTNTNQFFAGLDRIMGKRRERSEDGHDS